MSKLIKCGARKARQPLPFIQPEAKERKSKGIFTEKFNNIRNVLTILPEKCLNDLLFISLFYDPQDSEFMLLLGHNTESPFFLSGSSLFTVCREYFFFVVFPLFFFLLLFCCFFSSFALCFFFAATS